MQKSSKKLGVDLMVPIYKNSQLTQYCIDSILANIDEISAFNPRLILVNDSPDDDAITALLASYVAADAGIILIENAKNLGFVKSVNCGLAISINDDRDVILINSDTETFPGTLLGIMKVATSNSQIAFVSPRSNNASLCSLPHFYGGVAPTPKIAYENWNGIAHLLPEFHFTPTAIGFYLFIKNVVISNFGGLREDFGLGYEEENDLVLRANKAGYLSALANHSFAFHAGSASFSLVNFDLSAHKNSNLEKIKLIHPEFIPLVQRYEASPHFRTERIMSELVGLMHRKIEIVFELSGLGCNHNGTNEFSISVIRSFYNRHCSSFNITVICSPESFDFHDLNQLESLRRENEWDAGTYAIAVKLSQPFDLHQINIMEDLAPINFYAMLDTIAEDCGYLSITQNLSTLWHHVSTYANGIIYISKFSQIMFESRFPNAVTVSKYTRLLPTRLSSYPARTSDDGGRHILILGNHFAHKGSDAISKVLSERFPRTKFVVLGANTDENNNLVSYRSGTLSSNKIDSLFSKASAVVLPSHVEGFGFGLMHALSRQKVVFARDIEVTTEILSTFTKITGVHLYQTDKQLMDLVGSMTTEDRSSVGDESASGWEEWVDGLADFCKRSLSEEDIFSKSRDRLRHTDTLRRAGAWDAYTKTPPSAPRGAEPEHSFSRTERHDKNTMSSNTYEGNEVTLQMILSSEGSRFISLAYQALLKRTPDSEGETYYFARLEGGISKLQIIHEISESTESKNLGVQLKGLDEALAPLRRRKKFSARRLLDYLK